MDNKPLFIKINDYKDIRDIVQLVKAKVGDIKKTLYEIDSLKRHEEEELARWHSSVDEIEKKIDVMTHILHHAGDQP
ncbi:MAG: hypothetical protein Q7R76_06925 [Candidatus Woesearchaeota archaeon]|nr:hypothetical protein [Candidatus Woesearchaeota archaeon]